MEKSTGLRRKDGKLNSLEFWGKWEGEEGTAEDGLAIGIYFSG
jgi:hypothetical protein